MFKYILNYILNYIFFVQMQNKNKKAKLGIKYVIQNLKFLKNLDQKNKNKKRPPKRAFLKIFKNLKSK